MGMENEMACNGIVGSGEHAKNFREASVGAWLGGGCNGTSYIHVSFRNRKGGKESVSLLRLRGVTYIFAQPFFQSRAQPSFVSHDLRPRASVALARL